MEAIIPTFATIDNPAKVVAPPPNAPIDIPFKIAAPNIAFPPNKLPIVDNPAIYEPAPPPPAQAATVLTPVAAAGAPAPAVKYVNAPAPTIAAPVIAKPK